MRRNCSRSASPVSFVRRRPRNATCATLVLGVALATPGALQSAGDQSATTSQPSIGNQSAPGNQQSAVPLRLVTIDATATDARGRRVDDLKAADFELKEEGAAIAVESVRLIRGAAPAVAVVPVAIENVADERRAASVEGARLFAMFLDEYHVSSGPNTDRVRDTLLHFLDSDVAPGDLVVVMKPLDSLFEIRLSHDRAAARRAIESFSGRKGEYDARNAYERDFIAGTPARIESARNQVALSAVNALAVHLGSLSDWRKTLIVATEGIGRADRRRGQELMPTIDTVVRSANRSNVAIYPFDPRRADTTAAADEGLTALAADTDGRVVGADAATDLHAAASDGTTYYLVSFRSAHADDGKFRELQMRVKRAGVRVRSRKGYWAAPPDEALRTALLAKANEPKKVVPLEPAPHVSPLIRPWFGVSRGEGGKSRVTFVWEPAARVPGERTRRSVARLVLTAKAADGTVLFEGPVAPTGPAAIDDPAVTSSRAVFDIAPGRLRLRMAIQDAASTLLDQDVREMSIRDLRGDVAIGTPEVLRARNAREFRSLDAEAAVPVASREFSRTEHLLIRFAAYGPGGAAPAVSARLLARTGQQMRELPVAPASTPGANAIDLPLAGLAAGEYTVEVKATSGRGDARDRIGFRVTS
jgi:VWFA-related protein